MDGYGNLIAARLRKLAVARSTGMLPFSGDNDGAIYFKDGKIVFAESKRTPGPAIPEGLNPVPPGLASPAPADPAEAAEAASPPPFSKLSTLLMVTEPTVDAALELLSSESRYAKFRSGRSLSFSPAFSIPLEWLLAEVARRQQLLGQLSGRRPRVAATMLPPSAHVGARKRMSETNDSSASGARQHDGGVNDG